MSETLWVSVSISGVATNLVIRAAELAQMGETLAQAEPVALGTKKSTEFISAFLIWWVVVGSNHWLPPCEGGTLPLS